MKTTWKKQESFGKTTLLSIPATTPPKKKEKDKSNKTRQSMAWLKNKLKKLRSPGGEQKGS